MNSNFEIKAQTHKIFEVNGAKLAYDVVVPSSNAPKTQILLLINGFQRTRQDFRVLRQKLAQECPEIITVSFDNRFCGQTEVLQNPEETTLPDFAQDALLLLKHCMNEFGIHNVHVLGISMGGMIAQLLANLSACPALSTLFLVSTTAGGEHRVWPTADVLQQKHLGAELSHDEIAKRLSFYFGQKFLKSSPLLFKMFVQNMEKNLNSPSAQEAVKKQSLASQKFDGVQNFEQLHAKKIVIITGDEDHILPHQNSEIMHKIMPNSDLIVYPNIGHLILIENSNQFLQDISSYLKKDYHQ